MNAGQRVGCYLPSQWISMAGRNLLKTRWFVRSVVLDDWFLHAVAYLRAGTEVWASLQPLLALGRLGARRSMLLPRSAGTPTAAGGDRPFPNLSSAGSELAG